MKTTEIEWLKELRKKLIENLKLEEKNDLIIDIDKRIYALEENENKQIIPNPLVIPSITTPNPYKPSPVYPSVPKVPHIPFHPYRIQNAPCNSRYNIYLVGEY